MNNNDSNTNMQNPQANQNTINNQTTVNNTNVQQPIAATNNTSTSDQPVAQNNINVQPTQSTVNTQPVQTSNVQEPKIPDELFDDDDDTPSGDADDITFDYNQIYGVQETENSEKSSIDNNLPVYDEKEIVIDEDKLKRETNDVVPEFRIDELEGNSSSTNKSIDNLVDDKDADKADTKRKIAYILAITLILIVFVWFIFPIMAGYNF